MPTLNAPDINQDLRICNGYQYIKEIDSSLSEELQKEDLRVIQLIEEHIYLEISRYVLFHVSEE